MQLGQYIGVAKIFWLEERKLLIICNNVISNFRKELFMRKVYRRMENQKLGPGLVLY